MHVTQKTQQFLIVEEKAKKSATIQEGLFKFNYAEIFKNKSQLMLTVPQLKYK